MASDNMDDRMAARLKLVEEHIRLENQHDLEGIMGLSERQRVTTMNPWRRTTPGATKSEPIMRVCCKRYRDCISTFGGITQAPAPSSSRSSFADGIWAPGADCRQPDARSRFHSVESSPSTTKIAWPARRSITIGPPYSDNWDCFTNRTARWGASAPCSCTPSHGTRRRASALEAGLRASEGITGNYGDSALISNIQTGITVTVHSTALEAYGRIFASKVTMG